MVTREQGVGRGGQPLTILAELAEGGAIVAQAARTGIPVLRHTWVHHPQSAAALVDDAFFFGATFFVVPTLVPGASEVTALLPPGDWIHLWSGDRFDGDTDATVPTPLGRPAVFFRSGDEVGRELRDRLLEVLA